MVLKRPRTDLNQKEKLIKTKQCLQKYLQFAQYYNPKKFICGSDGVTYATMDTLNCWSIFHPGKPVKYKLIVWRILPLLQICNMHQTELADNFLNGF